MKSIGNSSRATYINLAIAINRKYVRYAYVMLTSFLLHHSVPVTVFVMHRDLLPEDMDTLNQLASGYPVTFEYTYVPDSLMPSAEILATSAWGPEAYYRLAITDLLPPEIDRVLYLDTDMIINHPLNDMYFCDFAGKRIAACKEHFCTAPYHNYRDDLFKELIPDDFCYFNSGTILYDLTALRMDCSFKSYMDLAERLNYKIQFPDQDLLNYRHHKDVLFLDTTYNLNARYGCNYYNMHYEDMKKETAVIHYASSKPWRGNFVHCDVEQIWWDYAAQTPFFDEFLTDMLHETMMDDKVNSYITDTLSKNEELYHLIDHYDQLLKDAGILI